jgi:hypothetical protein
MLVEGSPRKEALYLSVFPNKTLDEKKERAKNIYIGNLIVCGADVLFKRKKHRESYIANVNIFLNKQSIFS